MSSSSSLAAARRRRAGGVQQPTRGPTQQGPGQQRPTQQGPGQQRPTQQGPGQQRLTQQGPGQQRPTNPPTPPTNSPSPFVMLQQHSAKIQMMENAIRELASNKSSIGTLEGDSPEKQQFDLTELSDLIMSRVESTMDLKAFYENDQKLASELEMLQKTVESQQVTINSLNNTLHYIIQNLGLSMTRAESEPKIELDSDGNEVVGDNKDSLEKSVTINEDENTVTEFSQIEEDDDGSNYKPLTEEETSNQDEGNHHLEIGSVD